MATGDNTASDPFPRPSQTRREGIPHVPGTTKSWLPRGRRRTHHRQRTRPNPCRRCLGNQAVNSPVIGQGRIIRGCRALDRNVPFDAGPGELDQVAAAVAVSEYPVVVPGFAVLAEVPGDDPAPRLVLVAPPCPLVEQLPYVAVQ